MTPEQREEMAKDWALEVAWPKQGRPMPDAFVAGWTRQQGRVDAALARVAELEKNLPKTADGVVVQDGMTLHHKTDDDETLRKFAFASLIEIDGDFVESCYGVGDCYSTRAAALSAK